LNLENFLKIDNCELKIEQVITYKSRFIFDLIHLMLSYSPLFH